MSWARDLIHEAVGCEPGSPECDRITALIDEVADDRAHREAMRLRQRAEVAMLEISVLPGVSDSATDEQHKIKQLILGLAALIDPHAG